MGAKIGAGVELEKAPLKYQGLAPWEIWLSEAQERMVLAVPPENLPELLDICAIEEVEASIIGTFTDDASPDVTYNDQLVADMEMEFLHDGHPDTARWRLHWTASSSARTLFRPQQYRQHDSQLRALSTALCSHLLALLRHPNIASKEEVVRRYDHEVQGATVLKPLVGARAMGQAMPPFYNQF